MSGAWHNRHRFSTSTRAMPPFTLRSITPDDAALVAQHRAAMFHDMGSLAADEIAPLVDVTTTWLRAAIAAGEYHGWLAAPTSRDGAPGDAVAGGAGIQIRSLLPRPNRSGRGLLTGRQGLILNVYVEPPFRRQGLARLLIETVLDWARAERLASVVLHASAAGRPLYEQLGFVATNEMRYDGGL
jgi:GNAT superfamily N-acetyltransferase